MRGKLTLDNNQKITFDGSGLDSKVTNIKSLIIKTNAEMGSVLVNWEDDYKKNYISEGEITWNDGKFKLTIDDNGPTLKCDGEVVKGINKFVMKMPEDDLIRYHIKGFPT